MAEEKLREASCLGNLVAVTQLLQTGVNVNSQNSVNGWTALHWACKRGHLNIVECLLKSGADSLMQSYNGKVPSDLTSEEAILSLLPSKSTNCSTSGSNDTMDAGSPAGLPIVPNYLKYPVFPYTNTESLSVDMKSVSLLDSSSPAPQKDFHKAQVYIVKVRVADSQEKDFVEFELENMSFDSLLKTSCEELEVRAENVLKIRKLPNILVRKDKDVLRLTDNDYLEIVLKTDTCT